MTDLTKQMQKYTNLQLQAKLQETLSLSKNIISGEASIAQIEMGLTMAETFNKPNIRSVFKNNESIGFSVAQVLVTRFADSFGFSNKLSGMQIETITVDTLENFAYESLQDIVLFFKMARSGKFGTTGRGIDSNLIFGDWYTKYLDQKSEIREREYEKTKNERNAKPTTQADVEKTYRELTERTKKKQQQQKVQAFIDKTTAMMDRQMLEDTILDWSKDPVKKPYLDLLKRKRRDIKN